jgi:hypothetical protein
MHQAREDGTKMAHDVDVGSFGATNDDNMAARLPYSFKLSGIQV